MDVQPRRPGQRHHKTTDAGRTWTKLGGGLPGGMLGRIGLDVYAKNPQIVCEHRERQQAGRAGRRPARGTAGGQVERRDDREEVYRSDDGGEDVAESGPIQRIGSGITTCRSAWIERRQPRLRPQRGHAPHHRRRQDVERAVPVRRRQPCDVDRSGELEAHPPGLRPRDGHHLRRRRQLVPIRTSCPSRSSTPSAST